MWLKKFVLIFVDRLCDKYQSNSGKSATIRESNQALGVHMYDRRITRIVICTKSSILLDGKGVKKISFLAREFSRNKIYLSNCLKSLISRIIVVYVFFNKMSL